MMNRVLVDLQRSSTHCPLPPIALWFDLRQPLNVDSTRSDAAGEIERKREREESSKGKENRRELYISKVCIMCAPAA